MIRSRMPLALTAALSLSLLVPVGAQAAPAVAGPAAEPAAAPAGEPWVVSLGDSFISGEAGRWAGNESFSTSSIAALGRGAYWDAGDRETIERCHRSRSAAIHIGVVKSLNLACSGAITSTEFDGDGNFKPGIDFYDQGGRQGQALMLQEFASQNNVKMVALSIGGNDFKFSPIIAQCVQDYLLTFSANCKDDAKVQSFISDAAADRVRANTTQAILNVATAMQNAGYDDGDWTLVLQMYPQPLPGSANMRYDVLRQNRGGCGFTNADLDWAATTLLPLVNSTFRAAGREAVAQRPSLQLAVMDSSRAFNQRQLCHDAVSRIGIGGPDSWRDKDAVDRSEWVMEINIVNAFETYQQESLHPNYWGQLALRNCWRQVWNGGDVRGGVCERSGMSGLTADCEPAMTLTPTGRASVRTAGAQERAGTKVTLRCPGISIDPGDKAVLKGRVIPAGANVKVTYQVRWEGTQWRDKATVRPTARGSYRFAVQVPRSAPAGRTYEWRVVATKGRTVVATSQIRSSLVR
ncbi:MAG: hypothetical protein ACO4BY_05730 [Candidatus Nanopelagicales bacterium]